VIVEREMMEGGENSEGEGGKRDGGELCGSGERILKEGER
jgi:hypothetical protein